VAAGLVHAAGSAGSLHGDHSVGAGVLAKIIIKSCRLFYEIPPKAGLCRLKIHKAVHTAGKI
jgi:hypothetical protein